MRFQKLLKNTGQPCSRFSRLSDSGHNDLELESLNSNLIRGRDQK